uniref:Serum amyloid A n=1 Tax=Xiphophorus maculatus TaxID=8083 RepID=A0A3B5RD17_XIPMA
LQLILNLTATDLLHKPHHKWSSFFVCCFTGDIDQYFHARGNCDAAQRGPGGCRGHQVRKSLQRDDEWTGQGQGPEDEAADQAANRWGRSGGDPNRYRPNGLPEKY